MSKVFFIKWLCKNQYEILKLKYAIASDKVGNEAKEEISQLQGDLHLAKRIIKKLHQAMDTERSAINDIQSKFISA